jgi:hypothetical protein
MTEHPISLAFETFDRTPSHAFRQQLRSEFLAALAPREASDGNEVDNTVPLIEATRHPQRRLQVLLGVAAAIATVAALTAVVVNRHSEPNAIGTSSDPAIAQSSLISPKAVGVSWSITHQWDSFTSRVIADIAATVPACDAYVDYAFDSPRRQAVTAGSIFSSAPLFALTQWVYIFPTKAAATRAMDKITEASFAPCLSQFMDALMPKLAGSLSNTTIVDPPPLAPHGDRQVVLGQSIHFTDGGTYTVMNTFVQVGRGIVYVNPTPDAHDSLDPASRLEKVLTAATDNLRNALDAGSG